MKCTACRREISRKEAIYSEAKDPYCVNPFICNEDHPNSPANIIARNAAVKMYSEEELETNLFDRLKLSPEMRERILKIATKPQSIRLSKYDIAYYLIRLQEAKELTSISEAVRYCVLQTMQLEPVESFDRVATTDPIVVSQQETEQPQPLVNPIEKRKGITIIPKEPERKEEEEFTF